MKVPPSTGIILKDTPATSTILAESVIAGATGSFLSPCAIDTCSVEMVVSAKRKPIL